MTTAASTPSSRPTWANLLTELTSGRDLGVSDTWWAMNEIMTGNATDVQIASFLIALRSKGESVGELQGLVEAMLANANPIDIDGPALDIVGTGGDRLNTVNISTMAALVAAGAGARIVKHGNRAASSSSGSADVLEALGVRLDLPIDRVEHAARQAGITFCFAQMFHPSMRFAAVARSEMAIPTTFNFLGPLTNPAHVQSSAVGVADPTIAPLVAGVFAARGTQALVFRGDDGLDELTITGPSRIWEVRGGAVHDELVDPLDLGIERASVADLRGGDATHNAQVVRNVLAGQPGPIRDAVLLNAAAGLVAFDEHAEGPLVDRLAAALLRAAASVDSGAATKILDRWIAATG